MAWLRDLIAIPERVHQGDCVLQLSKGVTEPEQTPRGYVVAPQLDDLRGWTPVAPAARRGRRRVG